MPDEPGPISATDPTAAPVEPSGDADDADRVTHQIRPRELHAAVDDTIPASAAPASEPPTTGPRRPARPSFPGISTTSTRYRLGAELGRGGMGRVVEAFDVQLARTVALKEVLPRGGASVERRFAREVQITARLEHPAIVPLYDAGLNADGRPYYVMRRVTGQPLDQVLGKARGLAERLVQLPAVLAATDAIAHAHRRGVIHRDLKPANILVGELGETVVIDWGLAKVIGESDVDGDSDGDGGLAPDASASLQTQAGAVFGTPGFMSPEQARGDELDPRSDVYALGATLYQLLTGKLPHGGATATEVLARTQRARPIAVSTLAPGAPPELIAIVDQALAFDPSARYADAAALGADLRRFLSGQLVAAHRYTPRQRVVRFARRHRATLAVAAISAVALGVLATVSIRRILVERDAADAARHDAQDGRRAAEQSRDRLADQNDALLVTQARALLDTNPTLAIATLKHVRAGSPQADEARAVAASASMRGVAWAMPANGDYELAFEISPDGDHLLEATRDDVLHGIDLVARRRVWSLPVAGLIHAGWIDGGHRVLVVRDHAPPSIYDPAAGRHTPLALPPAREYIVDDRGDRVLFIDERRLISVLDVAARTTQPLWPEHTVRDFAFAADARWAALSDAKQVVVLDDRGRELGHLDGDWPIVVGSRGDRVAVLGNDRVIEGVVANGAVTWHELPVPKTRGPFVLWLQYRGDRLLAGTTDFRVVAWRDDQLVTQLADDRFIGHVTEVGDHLLAAIDSAGVLHVLGDNAIGAVPMPATIQHLRVTARLGHPRLVVGGDDVILVFDVGAMMPTMVATDGEMTVVAVGDDHLLFAPFVGPEWTWRDLRDGTTSSFDITKLGQCDLADVSIDGRVFVEEHDNTSRRLAVLRPGGTLHTIVEGERAVAADVDGDAIVYSTGDNRVMATIGDQPPREIAKLEGRVTSVTGLDHLRYAATSSSGELVRGSLVSGELERIHVDVTEPSLAADNAGHPLLFNGARLYVWDHGIREVARFEAPIERVRAVEGGALVMLDSHKAYVVNVSEAATPQPILPPSPHVPIVSADGRMVAQTIDGTVAIVELPSRARWTLPARYNPTDALTVSATSRVVGQGVGEQLATWHLPRADRDLAAWLDELTNATATDGLVTWPWQVAPVAP